ncbi:HAD family phosphatase [Lentimicrobium sp.]
MARTDISQIKVVFLDIGGVILTNGWGHLSRQQAAKHFGFDYDEMNVLHHFIYNVFEIGSITLDEYLDIAVFHCTRDFTKDEFKKFMYAQSVELPQMLSWLKSWKKQIDVPVFALSNESRELNDFRIDKFKLHALFDGFFSSCYLGLRKPDPRIYRQAMQTVHANPAECLYIDDRLMLANTANKLGMIGIHHETFETTRKFLERYISK